MNKEKFLKELKRTRSQAESLMYSLHYLLEETVYDARDYVDNELMKPIFDELDNQEQAVMNGEVSDSRRVKDSDENSIKAVIDDFVSEYYPQKTVEEYNINGEGNELLASPYIDGCWAYVFKSEEDAEQYVLSGAFNDMLNGATDFDSWVHILESNGVETDYAEELLESGNWDEITRIMLDGEGCEFFMSGYAGQVYYVDDYVIYF